MSKAVEDRLDANLLVLDALPSMGDSVSALARNKLIVQLTCAQMIGDALIELAYRVDRVADAIDRHD